MDNAWTLQPGLRNDDMINNQSLTLDWNFLRGLATLLVKVEYIGRFT